MTDDGVRERRRAKREPTTDAQTPSQARGRETEAGETPMNAKKTKYGTRYDGELQMFCNATQEPNIESLRFMRWLVEQGRLEHEIAGPSTGEYAEQAA